MISAIVYGLMPDERWNARFNPSGPQHRTGWSTVIGVIAALVIGAGVLMATIAFSAQAEGAGVAVFLVPAAGGEAKQFSPATSVGPQWRPDGREVKVMQCDQGYCTVDIWSAEGKRLRTLSLGKVVYEFDLEWSSDGSQALVGWQDFLADGSNRVDLRPAAGGSTKSLARPAGFTMAPLGFGDGDKTAIVMGGPYGTSLQRIDVSALAAAASLGSGASASGRGPGGSSA